MKQLMITVVVIPLTFYLGLKRNVISINISELHKSIPDVLQWTVKVLLAALIGSLLK